VNENAITKAIELCNKQWFFGPIDRDSSESRLKSSTRHSFLVRMTIPELNPDLPPRDILSHPFTFSYYNAEEGILHLRLTFDIESNTYILGDTRSSDDIISLVESEADELNVTNLNDSPYYAILNGHVSKKSQRGYAPARIVNISKSSEIHDDLSLTDSSDKDFLSGSDNHHRHHPHKKKHKEKKKK